MQWSNTTARIVEYLGLFRVETITTTPPVTAITRYTVRDKIEKLIK